MNEAGLTVGGFYKHFDSRDELVAEAVSAAFGIWQRQKEAAESGGQPLCFAKLVDDYLSDVHRKNPGTGCAFSALAPEIARSDKRTRALTSEQVRNDLELIVGYCQARTGVRQRANHPDAWFAGRRSCSAMPVQSVSNSSRFTMRPPSGEFVALTLPPYIRIMRSVIARPSPAPPAGSPLIAAIR